IYQRCKKKLPPIRRYLIKGVAMSKANESCKQAPGKIVPLIDLNRCEGKGPCVSACPYEVLLVKVSSKEQRTGLSIKGKIKGFVHGWKYANVIHPDLCQACGECVKVCPEQAITLVRREVKLT
ncbi:MAG: ferredoxin family protein, partial [Undibacterium sp.]|nr:ferredoxin family protein [Undibacterium sp.]